MHWSWYTGFLFLFATEAKKLLHVAHGRGGGVLGFSAYSVLAILWNGFSIFVPKTVGFTVGVHCGLRIFCFFAFGFRFLSKIVVCFRIWYPMWFLLFSYLGSGFSSISAPALISNSREAQKLHRLASSVQSHVTPSYRSHD